MARASHGPPPWESTKISSRCPSCGNLESFSSCITLAEYRPSHQLSLLILITRYNLYTRFQLATASQHEIFHHPSRCCTRQSGSGRMAFTLERLQTHPRHIVSPTMHHSRPSRHPVSLRHRLFYLPINPSGPIIPPTCQPSIVSLHINRVRQSLFPASQQRTHPLLIKFQCTTRSPARRWRTVPPPTNPLWPTLTPASLRHTTFLHIQSLRSPI
ncbi:hypothetical protein F5883DRAFT_86415 [Diaporthe sp. PMI_573]|nr:hypothetical protein F5883DRAFT_86415 [Diaporthaceae sp. PMI_573]